MSKKLYAVIAHDKPGAMGPRMALLTAHLEHVEAHLDDLAVAGPLKDDSGAVTGSLLGLHAENEAEARALLASDPYYGADIWDRIEIRAFTAAAGTWVGGKNW